MFQAPLRALVSLSARWQCVPVILALLIGCGNGRGGPGGPGPGPGPGVVASIDVSGTVLRSNGETVADALVEMNGRSTTTNADGHFVMRGVPLPAERGLLTVTKTGFFRTVRAVREANGSASLTVQLQDRALTGSVDATLGGAVATAEGMQVRLPANAIAGGYTGEVRLFVDFIDPSSDADAGAIPGLEAENALGESGVLESYGMATIEMEDDSGNSLELAPGALAELTFPVTPEQQAAGGPDIPLWWYDEDAGLWREEGMASLVGDTYVGQVSHFTTWNCDRFVCGLVAKFRILCEGDPLPNGLILLRLKSRPFLPASVNHTDSEGMFRTGVPCETEIDVYLVITGASTPCSWLLGTVVIPAALSVSDVVELNAVCPPVAVIRGTLVDCDNLPVSNGYVYARIGAYRSPIAFTDAGGAFTLRLYDCTATATEVTLVGWDLDAFVTSVGPTAPMGAETVLPDPFQVCGAAVSINGRIFVGNVDRIFRCLDAANGNTIWEFDPGGRVHMAPAVEDNRVYVGTTNTNQARFFCLNAADGSVIWDRAWPNHLIGSPCIDGDGLYVTSVNDFIYRLDKNTGAIAWTFRADGDVSSSVTVVGDVAYCGGGAFTDFLYAIDKTSGGLLWRFEGEGDGLFSPCVADGRVFVGSEFPAGRLFAVDAATGAQLWASAQGGGNHYSAPAANDGLVFAEYGRTVSAYRTTDGQVAWTYTDTESFGTPSSSPFYCEGRVYVGFGSPPDLSGGHVRCFEAATGNIVWEKQLSGGVLRDTVVVDGVLFTATTDKFIVALDASTGNTLWSKEFAEQSGLLTVVDDAGVTHYPSESGMRN